MVPLAGYIVRKNGLTPLPLSIYPMFHVVLLLGHVEMP